MCFSISKKAGRMHFGDLLPQCGAKPTQPDYSKSSIPRAVSLHTHVNVYTSVEKFHSTRVTAAFVTETDKHTREWWVTVGRVSR